MTAWTRDDLPSVADLVRASIAAMATELGGGADASLDAVVDHLNAHHPKPYPEDATPLVVWRERALGAELCLVNARRERDAAVARAEQAENARDTAATRAEQLEKRLTKAMSDYQDLKDETRRAEQAEAGPVETKAVTTVYRAHSPSRDKAGTTYADRARAQSQAAVRNQFVDCDPNTDALADWHVQTGHVHWETP